MGLCVEGIDVLNDRGLRILVEDGVIVATEKIEKRKGLPCIAPGLIDVQVNGNLGVDYSDSDLTAEDVLKVCRSLTAKGTFQHFPTVVTRPELLIERNLSVIAEAVRKYPEVASHVTGIHVEGPYISPDDGPRGAHDLRYVRKPSTEELDRWIECSEGLLKIVTIAPETEGSIEFIRHTTGRGIVCSLGHSEATCDQIDAAVKAGAKACTHIGNGSAAMIDRMNNHIIGQLANDGLAITIICDGSHVPPRAVKVFTKCRNEDDVVIITDLAPVAGQPKGLCSWGNMKVEIVEDGSVRLPGTPYLAGAGSPLIRNLGNYVRFTGRSLREALKACTQNPTRIYGLDPSRMEFRVGSRADFFVFDWDEVNCVAEIGQIVQGGNK